MSDVSDLEQLEGIAFETDLNGIIRDVGTQNWNAFASQNGAPELDAQSVIGRDLFDFVRGAEVRGQLRHILDLISTDPNWTWVLPFRCDAPERARSISQTLKPIFKNGTCAGFLFHAVELGSRPRPRIDIYDFKKLRLLAESDRDLPVIVMCSWCQMVESPAAPSTWVTPEDYYAAGGQSDVSVTHAICDTCLKMAQQVLRLGKIW